jgi:hypothetical protein
MSTMPREELFWDAPELTQQRKKIILALMDQVTIKTPNPKCRLFLKMEV